MDLRTYPDMAAFITDVHDEIAQWLDDSDIGEYTVRPTLGGISYANQYSVFVVTDSWMEEIFRSTAERNDANEWIAESWEVHAAGVALGVLIQHDLEWAEPTRPDRDGGTG
jgi:hypothetical protein